MPWAAAAAARVVGGLAGDQVTDRARTGRWRVWGAGLDFLEGRIRQQIDEEGGAATTGVRSLPQHWGGLRAVPSSTVNSDTYNQLQPTVN